MENQNVQSPATRSNIIVAESGNLYAISGVSSEITDTTNASWKTCFTWPACALEDRTFRIGRLLGNYPFLSIIIAISIVATGSMGLLNFHIESRLEELWVPPDSPAYLAKTTSRTFPVSLRIALSVVISAPDIFEPDIFQLMSQIDSIIHNFTFRGKTWDIICYRKNAECQKFSLLNVIDKSNYENITRGSILAFINGPTKRRRSLLPPYFITLEDILANIVANSSGFVVGAQVTRMVYYLEKQPLDRITSAKPVEPEEALRNRLVGQFGQGFQNVTVSISLAYAESDPAHISPVWTMEFALNLIYACIAYMLVVIVATGKYTLSQNGFWLAVSGVIGGALAAAFGFGIASAAGLAFTPVHFALPILFLSMSIFGFLVMETELGLVVNARPDLSRAEKMGYMMQRSFSTLVLCMLSNLLVFAVGIGSRLPVVRSFCVFGVTSAVGIFITQVLFLFGCLSAWQATCERLTSSWLACTRPSEAIAKNPASFHAISKPVFGFLASNLSENIPRILVLLGMAVLTGICIYFIFSLRIVFDLGRFNLGSDAGISSSESGAIFRQTDEAVGCVYLGNIPYHARQSELRTFQNYLKEHAVIRPRSIMSWFDHYQIWMADQQRLRAIQLSSGAISDDVSVSVFEQNTFYQSVTKFIAEKKFEEDVIFIRKPNEQVEIKMGMSADNYSKASEHIARVAADLQLGTALVDCDMMLSVLVQKLLSTELWILFGAYFVVLLIIAALILQSVVTALVVFVSLALLTMQNIGLVSSQKISTDSLILVTIFCFVSIASQMLFYEATVFSRLSGKIKSKTRLKSTMITAAPPAIACGICAVTTLVPFFNSSSDAFRMMLKVAVTTIAVAGLHVLLFLPVSLSIATPEAFSTATLRLRNRIRRNRNHQDTDSGRYYDGGVHINPIHKDSPVPTPNDQVHFVARDPLVRTSSVSSARIDLKNEGLRAVLESLPSPAGSVHEQEPVVSTNPNGDVDGDSLKHLKIARDLDQSTEVLARDRSIPSTVPSLPSVPSTSRG